MVTPRAARVCSLSAALPLTLAACVSLLGVDKVDYGSAIDGAPLTCSDSGMSYRELVFCDRPAAYWRLGEAPGDIRARDETGNGNDGTYVGGISLQQGGAISGDPNTAVGFDGTGSVSVGEKLDFAGNVAMSLEAWVAEDTMGDPEFLGKDAYRYFFWDNSLRFDHSGDGPDQYCYCIAFDNDAGALKDGQYHHLVATYDTVTMRLYADGVMVQNCPCSASLDRTEGSFHLGGFGFVGRLDEVAVYDHELTGPRVKRHFDVGKGR
jgi:hypothetical protein